MGRTVLGFCGLLVVISFPFQSTHADDRKSAGHEIQELKGTAHSPRETHAMSVSMPVQSERVSASVANPFEGRASDLIDHRLVGDGKENSSRPRDYKKITLLRLDSKLGEIKVQPIIGKVTGAQFSLGF